MKKITTITLIVLGVISAFIIILYNMFETKGISSIGIIGAADGPTSILITDKSVNNLPLFVLIGIILFTTMLFLIIKKKR